MKTYFISFYFQDEKLPDIISCYPMNSIKMKNTKEEAIRVAKEFAANYRKTSNNFYCADITQQLSKGSKLIERIKA
jgi:hypothetical protein